MTQYYTKLPATVYPKHTFMLAALQCTAEKLQMIKQAAEGVVKV